MDDSPSKGLKGRMWIATFLFFFSSIPYLLYLFKAVSYCLLLDIQVLSVAFLVFAFYPFPHKMMCRGGVL